MSGFAHNKAGDWGYYPIYEDLDWYMNHRTLTHKHGTFLYFIDPNLRCTGCGMEIPKEISLLYHLSII